MLLMILMIRGCANDVHPLIIKIVNNSETVDRSEKRLMYKGKNALMH